ncbi:MAG: hypothetical protein ACLVKO_06930 [Dysgonomonas sp.]
MKKLLYLLIILPFLAVSCGDDDNDEPDGRLVGTKWITEIPVEDRKDRGDLEVFEFDSKTVVHRYTVREKNYSPVLYYDPYTYKLNYPNIDIMRDKKIHFSFVFIDSNTMIRRGDNINENDPYMKFVKKEFEMEYYP